MMVLPPLLYQVLDHPDIEHTDTSSLRRITYGGTPSSPTRIAEAVRRLGPVLQQGYGQFEAGAISVLPAAEHDPERLDVLRTAGRPVPGGEVEIRDGTGRVLPAGEAGEICVRSGGVMEGYWKNPELTAQVLRDGWVHTGDLGSLDERGYLTVIDRIKDMIAVVGGHVYTTELEDFLHGTRICWRSSPPARTTPPRPPGRSSRWCTPNRIGPDAGVRQLSLPRSSATSRPSDGDEIRRARVQGPSPPPRRFS